MTSKNVIKWHGRKWRRQRGKTTFMPIRRYRPPKEEYWERLRQAGRQTDHCERCGSTYKITVHHLNGNPFDQRLENLQVLCWRCHSRIHHCGDADIIDEMEGISKEDYFW